jgi:hypothetical protein
MPQGHTPRPIGGVGAIPPAAGPQLFPNPSDGGVLCLRARVNGGGGTTGRDEDCHEVGAVLCHAVRFMVPPCTACSSHGGGGWNRARH